MNNESVIKPRHTPAQQAQRNAFLNAAYEAQVWINNVIWNAEKDNWPEVEIHFEDCEYDHKRLKSLLPTDRAKPRGD
ncbi:hypothetical protein HFX43_004950 [Salmonella enterica]|nr:hypothetical protein [Salmonella enterica]